MGPEHAMPPAEVEPAKTKAKAPSQAKAPKATTQAQPPSAVPVRSSERTLRSQGRRREEETAEAANDDDDEPEAEADVNVAEDEAVTSSGRPLRSRRRRAAEKADGENEAPVAAAADDDDAEKPPETEADVNVADAEDEEDPENRDAQQHEFITEDTANTRPAEFEYDDYNQEVIVVLENATLNDMETGEENASMCRRRSCTHPSIRSIVSATEPPSTSSELPSAATPRA